ncbi:Integral membrane sensor signal transduction histidine kinase [Hyella patelloides LEGE 07179]|uniref:histidine kinase n=1 Tax=Hyella patelloides LEGE 07179 TaxID=945734 RepID=A0A563VLX4_9CYAN|nr:sensor histidine kinase [Hyella patelloides]VEP12412.1 Integral membrane sensor signal transduction histidine kinase [Hyella patelloides LEGE 07179]
MIPPLKFLPNPFRFLLITEWVMLASCGSLAVVEAWQGHMIPVQHISILVALGLMGLILPNGSLIIKVIYTAIEIGLIFYGTVLGYLHILPTLYLIVVMRSCFLFESLGRWIVTGLVFILFLGDQFKYIQRALPEEPEAQIHFGMHTIAETLVFGLAIFFVLQLTNRILTERQMRQKLANAHEQLQQYAQKVEELATVQERNRIARDIHDSLGHALTSLNIQMQTAVKLWEREPAQARTFLAQAQHLGKTAMQEVRKSISTLREDAKDEKPLETKIEALVDDFRKGTGLSICTNISRCGSVPIPVAKTVYRIVQEALTNIFKYAQATEVQIHLKTTHKWVYLTVEDNGKGFDCKQKSAGFGLRGMQERVVAVNGQFRLKTSPGKGCRIEVQIHSLNESKNVLQEV